MAGALQTLVEQDFGIPIDIQEDPEQTNIGTSVELFLRNDPDRVGFIVVNLGDTTLYIKPKADVSPTSGIPVPGQGGSATVIFREDFMMVGMDWYAISVSSANDIYTMALRHERN